MHPAASVDAYIARPFGTYVLGPTYLHFFHGETLAGTVLWGRPTTDDVRLLTRALAAELPEHSPLHCTFADVSRLAHADADAFAALSGYIAERSARFRANVRKQAMVRPAGLLGALVTGFYQVTGQEPERMQFFESRSVALAWLDADPSVLDELEALVSTATGTHAIAAEVRAYVLAHPRRPTLAGAAAALGLRPDTLRDELRRAGTTFRDEVNVARVETARTLLAGSDTKLSAIADAIGCSSLQHFSNLFRKHSGVSPSEWRARHRSRA